MMLLPQLFSLHVVFKQPLFLSTKGVVCINLCNVILAKSF